MSAVLANLEPTPAPDWLDALELGWLPIVSREQRPIGMRVAVGARAQARGVPLAALLDSLLEGFVGDSEVTLPRGLVLLAPHGVPLDASLAVWKPPRNVMLEVPSSMLADEPQVKAASESQRQGVRLVLNAGSTPPQKRLPLSFQYVVAPAGSSFDASAGSGVLVSGASTREQALAGFVAGAHAMIGWPLEEPIPEAPGTLQPVQKAVLELIRLLQTEADTAALDRAFAADPVLTYLLLTLANSPAFRRGKPIGSVLQAITLLGYKRLLKWLVLLLVIASKGSRALPQIYAAVARGFFIENMAEATRNAELRDDGFVTGAFSLLTRITGIDAEHLFNEISLPETIVRAITHGDGPAGPLLKLARAVESQNPHPPEGAPGMHNRSLLKALACADALQSLV